MNKKSLLLTIPFLGLVTSCGCSGPEFREELKDFIYPITFDTAYNHVKKTTLIASRVSKDLNTDETLGEEKVYLFFNKTSDEDLFFHLAHTKFGELKEKDDKSYEEIKISKQDDGYSLTSYEDETVKTQKTSSEYCLSKIKNFFYLTVNNSYKANGMYYGDELQQMSRMQDFLSVSDDKKNLKIEVKGLEVEGIKTTYTLNIDKFGMLLDGFYDMRDDKKKLIIDIDINYNEDSIYDETKINELRGEKQ